MSKTNNYWSKWYAKNRKRLLADYRLRYRQRIKTETAQEREQRLAKQRKVQKAYEKRKKAKNVRSHGS